MNASPEPTSPSRWQRAAAFSGGRFGRWPVLFIWLLAAVAVFGFAGDADEIADNSPTSRLPAGAESLRAAILSEEEFDDDGHEPLFIIYSRQSGLTGDDLAKARADHDALAPMAVPGATTPPPVESEDGKAVLVVVALPAEALGEEALEVTIEDVRAITGPHTPSGLEVLLTGPVAAQADVESSFEGLDDTLLLVTGGIVAILLLLIYRSPLLLLLPLLSVGIASQLSGAVVHVLGAYAGLTVDSQSTGILTVLVFGVATDYALLLIARYREELRRHSDRFKAMRIALPRTLPTILASSGTCILAMLALVFADLGTTASLGPVAAVGIACALLTMTTLLPALLVLCGRAVFWPMIPRHDADATHTTTERQHRMWAGVAGFVRRHSRPVWIVTAVALAGLTAGIGTLSTGLSLSESFVNTPDSVRGQERMDDHYQSGRSAPVDIYAPAETADKVSAAVDETEGIDDLLEPATSADGSWVNIRAVLSDDPTTTEAENTVDRVRQAVHRIDDSVAVGGFTAEYLDVNNTMERDLWVILPVILLVVFGVLIVLLRALVAPMVLLASVVLSFGAAMGTAGLFLSAIGFDDIDLNLVLYGFLFLVALGVDYTIFLMGRAREEVAEHGHTSGVSRALTVTGGVITSAGIVLAATFMALTAMPLVFMMQIGVVVAIGVLLDTFVVRSLLVPALAHRLGRRTWWPGKLSHQAAVSPVPATEDPVPLTTRS